MAGISLEALDAVPWDRLDATLERNRAEQVPYALRCLALAGGAATQGDCDVLVYGPLLRDGRVSPVTTAALPFVVGLAADPGMGQRVTLVELLVDMFRAASAEPQPGGAEWTAAWQRRRHAVGELLADPDPGVRRAALPLAGGVAPLLERWQVEADPTVRPPVLLALGAAAAAEAGGAGGAGSAEEVRALLVGVLRDGGPVIRVAAVHALARLDPQVPIRQVDVLLEALCDTAAQPEFDAAWYVPGVDRVLECKDVVSRTVALFENDPETATSFVVGLTRSAVRTGDTFLIRIALAEVWWQLVLRPSAAPAVLQVAGELLANPDDGVRFVAAKLLAMLGRRAAPYADRLAALVDDPGEDQFDEGTVGDYARWALARIGDPRALPGLVERLYERYSEEYSRCYSTSGPFPSFHQVLAPLREHADILLPALRAAMRDHAACSWGYCELKGDFLKVLEAWGEDAQPALPEVLPGLEDPRSASVAVDALVAMGRAAASAEPALRGCAALDLPGIHWKAAWAARRIGGDGTSALRLIGQAVLDEEGPLHGPVDLLADFGPAAAPYADRVRHIMANTEGRRRLQAAITLWSITGEPEPSVSVLEEFVLPIAHGDDGYRFLGEALRAIARIGLVTPAVRGSLLKVQGFDRRLSLYRDERAFLEDERLRTAIGEVLALT